MTIATMGRGGNSGQAIRDRILEIMHKHHIPERAETFIEQWHQKLHNNTTPEDLRICKAYIRWLRSNCHENFYHILESEGLTRENLKSYERPIVASPAHPGCDPTSLASDLSQYLEILKDVHDGLDLKKSIDRARGHLDQNLIRRLYESLGQLSATNFHDTKKRIFTVHDIRTQLSHEMNNCGDNVYKIRDLLLLDFALEGAQNSMIQGIPKDGSFVREWFDIIGCLIEIWTCHNPESKEWSAINSDWCSLGYQESYFSTETANALMAKALLDRLSRCIGDIIDSIQGQLGPISLFLGKLVGVPEEKLNVFVDEVLRGTLLFSMAVCVKQVEPEIRKLAKVPPWQMISPIYGKPVCGVLKSIKNLSNIQTEVFSTPTILICDYVNGQEEIPIGVTGVLVRNAAAAPDILSHIAVRARNSSVLLAVCFETQSIANYESLYSNQWVAIRLIQGGSSLDISLAVKVQVEEITESSKSTDTPPHKLGTSNDEILSEEESLDWTCSRTYFVTVDDFSRETVGSKSLNLVELKNRLSGVRIPQGFALPYGAFQKALGAQENRGCWSEQLKNEIKQLRGCELSTEQIENLFASITKAMREEFKMPKEMVDEIRDLWKKVDEPLESLFNKSTLDQNWEALCRVWDSMYSMRPWVSLKKAGRSFRDLNMAVLVQELVAADYGFVLHSRNPFDLTSSGMYGEIVIGLGEVLVSNHPGRAMSWTATREGKVEILAFPAKSGALYGTDCLIFRSDSNGEDLEGFAGAGLFESIPAIESAEGVVVYSKNKLIMESEFRETLLRNLGEWAFRIEDVFGKPMDIEGVVQNGEVVIVQARPQI